MLNNQDRSLSVECNSGYSIGIAARAVNSIDYSRSKNEIRSEEKSLVSRISGVDRSAVFFLDQEHADSIIAVNKPDLADTYCAGIADALVTATPGLCLVIRTADCVPVMLIDPIRKVIAAIHSGWKSSALGISAKVVKQLTTEYSSDPANIIAYILPSIGPESYQVQWDVAQNFADCYTESGSGYYLNLWQSVESSLRTAGVMEENIFNCHTCTLKNNREFFSHRAGDAGRNLNFILMK